jgi:hypothetical protein
MLQERESRQYPVSVDSQASRNAPKGDGTRPVAVRLLDTSGSRSRFARSLGCKLLTGRLATSGLACGLLGTGHGERFLVVQTEVGLE